ncbi:hypothetical protein DRQ50_09220 [bacterium]|nr:MAG: hypothetical protein DRQ50_09220 [bacterium]
MKFARTVMITLALAVLVAGTTLAELDNAIGIYHPLPTGTDNLMDHTNYTGQPGAFQVYAVLTNPNNDNTGTPIANLGGFEFRLELPGAVALTGVQLPASCTNFLSPPEFLVGANLPVIGGMVTLATISLAEMSGQKSSIYLAPVNSVASIPGAMAIADADDEFSLSEAVPASGGFDVPVFGLYFVPPEEDASWGRVKTLYR